MFNLQSEILEEGRGPGEANINLPKKYSSEILLTVTAKEMSFVGSSAFEMITAPKPRRRS